MSERPDGETTVDVPEPRPAMGRDAREVAGLDHADQERPERVFIGSEQALAIDDGGEVLISGGDADFFRNGGRGRFGDRIFYGMTGGASAFAVALVILVGVFLLIKAIPAIAHNQGGFWGTQWDVTGRSANFGVSGLLYTTVLSSLVALILAVPISIGIALFITHYAPARLATPVAYAIDLLAAIPSIIYGVWGYETLAPALSPVQRVLGNIGTGLFDHQADLGTVFDLGVVLAVMILPIITAISRDVFERTPRANIEAALALGATKWEMIRMAVLPYGRAGVTSGAMLGLGRALGETMAALLILSVVSQQSWSLLGGGSTIAGKIALDQAEFGTNPGPYIAAGLVLFVLTFIVNGAARLVIARRKDFV